MEIYGLGTLLAMALPFIGKAIARKDFREFLFIGMKRLFTALLNRSETTHHIFTNVERYKLRINRIEFKNDPVKTTLFRILLTIKLDICILKIQNWIKLNERLLKGHSNKLELQTSFEILIYDMIDSYEYSIKEEYFKYFEDRKKANYFFTLAYNGVCFEDCIKLVNGEGCEIKCEKVIGFKEFHEGNIKHISRYLESMLEYGETPNSQMFMTLLNHIDIALHSAVIDAKEAFELQNGRYKTYNN